MTEKLLKIYLADHLAGAVGVLELARRCRASNEGSDLGDFLNDLIEELEEDKSRLEAIMDHVGAPRSPAKQAAVWVAEKVGRLKLNGQLTGYSDLSRLLELELLTVGITGKLSLWRSLIQAEEELGLPSGISLEDLAGRAESQLEKLLPYKAAAASSTLS